MNDLSKVENDEAPGIPPKGRVQSQGQCRYCGQHRMVWASENATQDELDEIAEADCNCPEGEAARMQAYNKNTAYAWADANWPDHGAMYRLMIGVIDAVSEYDANKVMISAADGITRYEVRLDKEERLIINTKVTQTKKARF